MSSSLSAPLLLDLEFLRVEQASDPYAFRFARQDYLLRSAGGGVESSWLSWDEALISDLAAVRLPGQDPAMAARLGETLRRFLQPLGWAQYQARLLSAVNERRPVILTVRSAAAELYALPWELLRLSASGQHVGELPGVLLRYEWPETSSIAEEQPAREGGRILFAWSAAAGGVPAAEQLAAIEHACQAGFHSFDAEKDVLAHASCGRISRTLEQASQAGAPFAILHLLCHGRASGTTFGLAIDGEDSSQGAVTVDAGRLCQLLWPYAKSLRLVILSACDSGNSGALGNQLGSIAQALHRSGIAAVVASRHPLSVHGSVKLTEVLYEEMLGRPASLESALIAARTALAHDARTLDWASVQLYARGEDGHDTRPVAYRPYRGLLAFLPEHTRFFFGRDAEREAATGKLDALRVSRRPRFLIVAGASGTGKSSVVRSGVVPDLLKRRTPDGQPAFEVAVLRPGEAPLAALNAALAARRNSAPSYLLVVDQFEELFTHTRDPQVRQDFIARLWALSRQETGVDCILTIRVDYLGQCGQLVIDESGLRLDHVAYDEAHRVFVAQLGAAQLRAAIEGPAQLVGLELQDGLPGRMIDEVRGEPGALPLLSYTLDLLWQKRRGRLLSVQSYTEIGGVIGALEGKANAVIDGLSPDEQGQARRILVRLVGLGEGAADTRRRIALRELQGERKPSFDTVLSAFVEARLVVLGEEQGSVTLELAHEALIRRWERLRSWLEKDREKLAEINEVERWVVQWRSYGTLLQGAQLGYAARVLEKHGEDISPDGRAMIAASQHTEERRRRQELEQAQERAEQEARVARRLRGAAAVLLVALIGTAGAGSVAWRKSREAKERFLSLLEEQGRERILKADPMRALVYLSKAYQEGSTGPATRFLLAAAAAETINTQQLVLNGHSESVKAAVFSPDGGTIATAGEDGTARLWDAKSGRLLRTLFGHSGPVQAVAFSPDGVVVATASDDQTTRLWEVKTGRVILTLSGHSDKVFAVAFSPDGAWIATSGKDKTARLWSAKDGSLRLLFSEHTDQVNSARWSPNGTRVVTASSDKTAKVWDAASGQTILTLLGHSQRITCAAWSPDGTRVLTASQDKTAKVWDAGSGQLRFTLNHDDSIEDGAFSPDGSRIITASIDQTAKVWDAGSGRMLLALGGHSSWVHTAAFSPDGLRAVTASKDHSARVWDIRSGPAILTLPDSAHFADFSPDARHVVTATADGSSRIWNARSGKLVQTLSGHTDRVHLAAFSPDGTRVVTASADRTARVWDAESGRLQLSLQGHQDKVHGAAFSPDGTRIVTASYDHAVRIFDAQSGALILLLKDHADKVHDAAFSPDGQRIVTASADRTARLWDAKSGQGLLTLAGHIDDVYSAVFSPDGTQVLTSSFDKTARLWDVKTGSLLRILAGHSDKVLGVRFSPDGAWALTASVDKTARLWECQSGKMVLGLVGHSDWVGSAVFSPDGRQVLTASRDKTARLFNLVQEARSPEVIAGLVRCLIPYRFTNDQVIPAQFEPSSCPEGSLR